jgi:hypothetical protein
MHVGIQRRVYYCPILIPETCVTPFRVVNTGSDGERGLEEAITDEDL